MTIGFKAAKRAEPGVAGGGTARYYPVAVSNGRMPLSEMAKDISRMSSLSRPDVHAVLEALTVLVPEYLQMGRLVELGNLGTLQVVLSGTGSDTAKEVTSTNIRNCKLFFRPGNELKNALAQCRFERVE